MDARSAGSRQTPPEDTTTGSTTGGATAQTTGETTDQTTGDTNTTTTGDTKTRPYNLIFAIVCVAAAVAAYLLTMWLFRDLIKNPEDAAIVSGALGVLFTLIGAVAGAYFAVKSTQDTADKAAKRVEEEAKRTERANQAARSTSGKG